MILTITNVDNDMVITETKLKSLNDNLPELRTVANLLNVDTLTPKQKKELAEIYAMTVPQLTAQFRAFKKQETLNDNLGSTPKDQYDYVALALKRDNALMTFQEVFTINTPYMFDGVKVDNNLLESLDDQTKQLIIRSDSKCFNRKEMLDYLIRDAVKLGLDFKDKEIEHGLTYYIKVAKGMLVGKITANICFDKKTNAEPEWEKFINAITDINPIEDKIVLKHFIWQVKRKMFSLPVKYHMMPILYGKQGSGKSTNARQFCDPIKEFVAWTDFSSISDNRDHSIWQNSVLVFDEMGNSTTANLEIIKQRLTSDHFTSRVMNTNGNSTITNMTTSLGTTNKDLTRMIFDESGMRRFYQIDYKNTVNWGITQNIDYLMLWRSIDENSETPLLSDKAAFDRIMEIQNQKRFVNIIESFLLQRTYPASGERLAAGYFFNEFQEFEKTQIPRPEMTAAKFGRDVMDIAKQVPGLTLSKKQTMHGVFYSIIRE